MHNLNHAWFSLLKKKKKQQQQQQQQQQLIKSHLDSTSLINSNYTPSSKIKNPFFSFISF